jgi:hypothetical protein
MLAKVFRINTTKDYANVQKNGAVYQYNAFGIAIIDRKDENLHALVLSI